MRRMLILAAAAAASAALVGSMTAVFSDPVVASSDTLARSLVQPHGHPAVSAAAAKRPVQAGRTPAPARASAAVARVAGLAGLCLDDAGGLAVPRGKVQIWPCRKGQAQGWVSANGELIHDGMCLNDSEWGGNYSHVIMWRCDGAANERWTYRDGSYVLAAGGGWLCLDDPAYSVRRGTQLIVYRCHGSANQRWSLPIISR